MDTLRGNFGSSGYDGDYEDYDPADDDIGHEPPPASIGTDERRMQVRAYNHWASLLGDRNFPSIEDLEPEELTDFGPHSVLLDFTCGIEDPAIPYLGAELAAECDAKGGELSQLSDVPSRSLLSRITDHYMQILANQAPIGFEAEFVNQRDATILYRGILLPYSSDGETIDFIYGVINWKEMADQATADELLLEIDQALEDGEPGVDDRSAEPVAEWADGPASPPDSLFETAAANDSGEDASTQWDESDFPAPEFGDVHAVAAQSDTMAEDDTDAADEDVVARLSSLIAPRKGSGRPSLNDVTVSDDDFGGKETAEEPVLLVSVDDIVTSAARVAQDAVEVEAGVDGGLYDCLAEARELAQQARSTEDRSRHALYAAVSRAYDVSLAAQEVPEEFAELLEENDLVIQDRAPMTPVVKLVFGADYDKTRLTEYAAVLMHARRVGIERGSLASFLSRADGGLKAVVQAERRMRKEESGETPVPANAVKPALAEKLRELDTAPLAALDAEGAEFGVVMIRRLADGSIVLLGEVHDDIPLVEKVARKLVS